VAVALRARGAQVALLDGDQVRAALRPPPGYDEAGRDAFYETLARLAALLCSQGLLVLVPATAHRRAFRERARALAPAFFEVWVDTPLAECMRRDSKGLYARARHEQSGSLPGIHQSFEPPPAAEHVVRFPQADAIPELIERIVAARKSCA
jgi:adenylylsulfate kinase